MDQANHDVIVVAATLASRIRWGSILAEQKVILYEFEKLATLTSLKQKR